MGLLTIIVFLFRKNNKNNSEDALENNSQYAYNNNTGTLSAFTDPRGKTQAIAMMI